MLKKQYKSVQYDRLGTQEKVKNAPLPHLFDNFLTRKSQKRKSRSASKTSKNASLETSGHTG